MLTLFDSEIKCSFPGGRGKPLDAFNISASPSRLFAVFTRQQKTIVSENLKAPPSVDNVLGVTWASKFFFFLIRYFPRLHFQCYPKGLSVTWENAITQLCCWQGGCDAGHTDLQGVIQRYVEGCVCLCMWCVSVCVCDVCVVCVCEYVCVWMCMHVVCVCVNECVWLYMVWMTVCGVCESVWLCVWCVHDCVWCLCVCMCVCCACECVVCVSVCSMYECIWVHVCGVCVVCVSVCVLYVWVWYVYICMRCVCKRKRTRERDKHVYIQIPRAVPKPEDQKRNPGVMICLITFSQGLSLHLELGWRPASLKQPLISASLCPLPQCCSCRHLCHHVWLYSILFYLHWCEGVRSPGTGVTDSCGCWELNPGPTSALNHWPSLQAPPPTSGF
jgi:hypothetical protein